MAVWSIVKRSKLQRATRIDSEYYQPEYLALDKELLSGRLRLTDIRDISSFVKKGIFDISPDKYIDHGIPLIRVQNIRSGFLSYNNMVFISETDHLKNKKTELTEGDLVLSKVGTIGEVAIISTKDGECNCSQNTIGVKINRKKIKSEYLLLYFLSNLGQLQLQRSQMFQVQSKLELEDIRDLKVVLLADSAQEQFRTIVAEIIKLRENSEEIYSQAERMLLDELGLKDLDLKEALFYTTALKEVNENNRMDAEYFMPKYNDLIDHIKSYRNGFCNILEVSKHITTNCDPKKEGEYCKYIELSNIQSPIGLVDDAQHLRSDEAPSRATRKIKTGDVIVSSIKGSLDKVALISEEFNDAFASNGFFQFRPSINSYYFLLLAKSLVTNLQLFREASGAILSAVPKESLKSIFVPKINESLQKDIADIVNKSHQNSEEAKFLLDQAIRKVQGMIEKEAGRN